MKINIEKCLCQSGLNYEDCCKNKKLITRQVFSNKGFSPSLIREVKQYEQRCIFGTTKNPCNLPPINSHTLQQNKILSNISIDGHVLSTRCVIKNNRPQMELCSVGIKKASIFHCLCSKHDDMIFKPIEANSFKNSKEEIFLHSFKAVYYTYWKTVSNYNGYKKKLFDKYNIHKAMLDIPGFGEWIMPIIKDKDRLEEEYTKFYDIYTSHKFEDLCSYTIALNYKIGISCCIDACIMYDIYGNKLTKNDDYYPSVYITCFTENDKSFIIFSWLKNDNDYYQEFFSQLRNFETSMQIKICNIILPLLSEDIYYYPKLFEKWAPEQYHYFFSLCGSLGLKFYQENGIYLKGFAEEANFNLFEPI